MSHKHARLLHDIFQDPASGNLHWREVESLLHHLDCTLEQHGNTVHIFFNAREGVLHRPHGNVFAKHEIRHLREVLASLGITPSAYAARASRAAS